MAKNVLVVGMPRSGTSMTAGIFARAGYYVTDEPEADLRPGDRSNPDGYWEAEGLIERNVEVFRAAGYEGHNTWLFDPIPPDAAARINQLEPLPGHAEFVAQFEKNAPWIWKDPRLSYTLGYWWKLLDKDRTRVVLTSREPDSIYRSFIRLGWRESSAEEQEDVHQRVADHVAAAQRSIELGDIPHMVVRYEQVAVEPDVIATSISAFCDVEVAAEDLGFDRRFDHSGVRGTISTRLERMVAGLPPGLKRFLKAITPRALITALFPGRSL